MKIDILKNHEGVPCIFFTGMDAKDQCDGFTIEEMTNVTDAINKSLKKLRIALDNVDDNQMEFEFIKDYEC